MTPIIALSSWSRMGPARSVTSTTASQVRANTSMPARSWQSATSSVL
jgi:hypothetical protein